MSSNVYKVVEIVGSSPTSTDEAVANGIARAAETLQNLEWFEVLETRGHVESGAVAHFQAVLKVGFRLND